MFPSSVLWDFGSMYPRWLSDGQQNCCLLTEFYLCPPFWWYHCSVETIPLESLVTSNHLCFDDFSSPLHDTFIRLVDSKYLPSFTASFPYLPLFFLSFFLSFSATRLSWRKKKLYSMEPLCLLEGLDFYAHSFYGSYKNPHSSLSLFVLVRFFWLGAVGKLYCFPFDLVSSVFYILSKCKGKKVLFLPSFFIYFWSKEIIWHPVKLNEEPVH